MLSHDPTEFLNAMERIYKERKKLVEAWIAATGHHPTDCMIVEDRSDLPNVKFSVVSKSERQLELERKASKPKLVADYLVEFEAVYVIDKHDNSINVDAVWLKETHEVGCQPEDSVLLPDSAREQE